MYVPELDEIIAGLHRILERDVIPSIGDRYARNQAMLVSTQLRDLMARWNALPGAIEQENEEMRQALATCEQWLANSTSSSPLVASTREAIRAQLRRTYPAVPPTRSITSIAAEHSDLLATFAETTRALLELERNGADDAIRNGHGVLRTVIRLHAERRDPGVDSSQVRHRN